MRRIPQAFPTDNASCDGLLARNPTRQHWLRRLIACQFSVDPVTRLLLHAPGTGKGAALRALAATLQRRADIGLHDNVAKRPDPVHDGCFASHEVCE